jgi:hypothetical protein
MLSLFPSLITFEPLAPLLLRLTLGAVILLLVNWPHQKHENLPKTTSRLLEGIIGILLIIGLWTQARSARCSHHPFVKTCSKNPD